MLRELRPLALFAGLLLFVAAGVMAVHVTTRPGTGSAGTRSGPPGPGKVVALSVAAEEIIVGLDGPERLAAVTSLSLNPRYSNIVSQAARVGRVVSGTSVERIARLRPDLVIVASYTDEAARAALERLRLPLFRLPDLDGVSAVRQAIRSIGDALGLARRAEEMVREMDGRIAAARARIPAGARPPRLLRYDPADAWVAGSGTVIDDVIRLAGAVNVAAEEGVRGTREVRMETVARWNPEVLVVEGEEADRDGIAARLRAEPLLERVAAVRDSGGRGLVVIPTRTLTAVSQYCAAAVERLAAGLWERRGAAGGPGEAERKESR